MAPIRHFAGGGRNDADRSKLKIGDPLKALFSSEFASMFGLTAGLEPAWEAIDMASLRPRPAVMTVTDRAANRVREIVEHADRPLAGLSVGVKKGGCAGMEYTLEGVTEAPAGADVVSANGVNVYIDPKAILFLLGTEMDFETSKIRSGFVFRNPNEVSSCGCGESVNLKPAEPEALGA
jgi:iron-sulfur cluster assembly protein